MAEIFASAVPTYVGDSSPPKAVAFRRVRMTRSYSTVSVLRFAVIIARPKRIQTCLPVYPPLEGRQVARFKVKKNELVGQNKQSYNSKKQDERILNNRYFNVF